MVVADGRGAANIRSDVVAGDGVGNRRGSLNDHAMTRIAADHVALPGRSTRRLPNKVVGGLVIYRDASASVATRQQAAGIGADVVSGNGIVRRDVIDQHAIA